MNSTLALIRALAFLQSRSLVNALKVRFRRLRQPKYLIGAVVGLGYMYLWFGRALFSGWRRGPAELSPPDEVFQFLEALGVVVVFGLLVGTWIFAGERASLRLSEAELNFLLPAPLTRKMLVRFRLIRAQVGTLLSALLLTLFTGRFARDGHAFIHMLSWWLLLTVLNLHSIGASFTIQRLSEAGLASWLRRLLALGVALSFFGIVGIWLHGLSAPQLGAPQNPRAVAREFNDWLALALNSGPAPWLFAPFRWLVRPWFAPDGLAFLRSLPPVLGLIGLHYWWIERSDVSFEEASLDAARKRADHRAAAKAGQFREQRPPSQAIRTPFHLKAVGFPPVALLWKHLIRTRLTARKLALGSGLVLLLAVVLRQPFVPEPVAISLAGILQLGLVPLLFVGGAITSFPLRRDLQDLDLLKSYPLPAWQIVLGQLLGGAAVIGAIQALVVVAAALCYHPSGPAGALPSSWLAIGAVSLLGVMLPLNLVNAFVPAAAMLLFPAWMKSGRDAHSLGFEVMGQRLLIGVLQLLATAVAWLPAGLLGVGGFFLGQALGGIPVGIGLAALLGATVLLLEAAAGIWVLGTILEKHDASEEQ